MTVNKDIACLEDIKRLVDGFYEKVRGDELLAPIFNEAIGNRWREHLEKMYAFWQTVLLKEHTYKRSPFPPHVHLPISHAHFDVWLNLWKGTVDDFFSGEKATEAKWNADKMAAIFISKMEQVSP